MKIKIILDNGDDKIIDLSQSSILISVSGRCFSNDDDSVYFKDIKKILFNESNSLIQMVDAIKDVCILEFEESNKKIELGTYKE